MRMDDVRAGRIVADALTLDERMRGALGVVDGGECAAAEGRLGRWRGRVADGDARRSLRRLRAEGWDEARVRAGLGAVRLPPGAPLPPWAAILSEAVELA